MIRIVKRKNTSLFWLLLAPNLAIVLTLLCGILMFYLLGFDPFEVLAAYFVKPLSSIRNISELCLKASPLILIGLGISFAFRANVWNIGAEGQYLLGAICGSAIALYLHEFHNVWILPLMIIVAIGGGMLWAMIPAFLKIKLNVNEILSSLMLNYIAIQLLLYMTHGPLKDPLGNNFPQSKFFNESAMLPGLLDGTRLNFGFAITLLLVLVFWFLYSQSLFGFQIKVKGFTEQAAKFAGISPDKLVILTMALSGGLAGMAGIFEIAGPVGQITASFSSNYGYTAIIVAFLGRLHPIGVLLAGMVIALTYIGSEVAQISLGLPLAATGVFQSLLLFFLLAGDFLRVFAFKYVKHEPI